MSSRGQLVGRLSAELAVTMAAVSRGKDTRGQRLFRGWSEAATPDELRTATDADGGDARILTEWLDRLSVPPAARPARLAQARIAARDALAAARQASIDVIIPADATYPEWLWQIPDPPLVLWAHGQAAALSQPAVAVVGSRDATPTGLAVARRLGRDLALTGLVVVSGLARGVDTAAHRGALDAGGLTVAVLGSGPDVIYPAANQALARDIAQSGVVVSEFRPGTCPLPAHFPLRNRIISGLSRAVVVVEAHERSGSLITARAAMDQGRGVLAVPGGVSSGRNRGSHALIKDGAALVETVDDILGEIGWADPGLRTRPNHSKHRSESQLEKVMAAGEFYGLDDLAARTGRSVDDLLAELAELELAGLVTRSGAGGFARLDGPAMDRE